MIYTGGQFHDEIYMDLTGEEFAEKIQDAEYPVKLHEAISLSF